MKTGTNALINEDLPVVAIALKDSVYKKIRSNMEEVRARAGVVIAIATDGDDEITGKADEIIRIPAVEELLSPVLAVVPLQLLAYHIADRRGNDVDQPRNLAKAVTVERRPARPRWGSTSSRRIASAVCSRSTTCVSCGGCTPNGSACIAGGTCCISLDGGRRRK